MSKPLDAGTPVQATISAPSGVNVRLTPGGEQVGKAVYNERVSLWPDTYQNSGGYTWGYIHGATADGWAAMGSGADVWITPDAPAPPPVEEPPNDPGLYSVALSGDEIRQLAELYTQAATTNTLIAGIYADLYRRIGGS